MFANGEEEVWFRGLPFRTSRGQGEGGSAKRGLTIYFLYRTKKKNRRHGRVNFHPKIEDVLYGWPLKKITFS